VKRIDGFLGKAGAIEFEIDVSEVGYLL